MLVLFFFFFSSRRRHTRCSRDWSSDVCSSDLKAIYQGCLIRFRPIMMTTMAALLGAVPIALGYGAGGEARQPLGMVVVGGLIFSQLVTLYLTPVFYTYMAQLHTWLKHRGTARNMEPQAAA